MGGFLKWRIHKSKSDLGVPPWLRKPHMVIILRKGNHHLTLHSPWWPLLAGQGHLHRSTWETKDFGELVATPTPPLQKNCLNSQIWVSLDIGYPWIHSIPTDCHDVLYWNGHDWGYPPIFRQSRFWKPHPDPTLSPTAPSTCSSTVGTSTFQEHNWDRYPLVIMVIVDKNENSHF